MCPRHISSSVPRRRFLAGTAGAAVLPAFGVSRGEGIGTRMPSEGKTFRDRETGRTIRQLTSVKANNYPLYYFTPSITADNRYLVFHSERSGWVQLYRLDLQTGESSQLTDGRTHNSGWMIWCEWRLRGIYNHLSALNQARREVYYFQDEEVRCTQLDTLVNRVVHYIPGRIPIGQSSFSPDGRHFAFIHADRRNFVEVMSDLESLRNMRLETFDFRPRIPATIGLIETETGKYQHIIELDFHVHHVIFADNQRVLVNHIRNGNGMWIICIDGSGMRTLRPPNEHGSIVHQVVTQAGIFYEAAGDRTKSGTRKNWFGRYDLAADTFDEVLLPEIDGYVHTGLDPAGRFLFFEEHGRRHRLFSLHFPHNAGRRRLTVLREMALYPAPGGQRYHAHPFLSPDRKWLFYTEVIDGHSQVCAIDVRDLVDLDEYW
jgi:WD40 repeat protein